MTTESPVQGLPFGVGGGLVAIKTLLSRDPCAHATVAIEMIDAILKEHSAAPVQEPVQRWAVFCGGCRKEWAVPHHHPGKSICAECETKLHTTPPAAQRQWVGLTEDEQDELVYGVYDLRTRMELAIGIEAKLKEKNT